MALDISAIIPTRGDVDLSLIVENLRQYPEVKEITFVVGTTPFNRYLAAERAHYPVILTQDDDCVTDMRTVIDSYRPGIIVNAMTESHAKAYQGEETLIGLGSVFDRDLVSVLDGWEQDTLFLRESDRVFATLNRHESIFPVVTPMLWATAANRLYRQPEHGASHVAIRERIKQFREARRGQ